MPSADERRMEPHEAWDIGYRDYRDHREQKHREDIPKALLFDYALGYETAQEYEK